MNIDDPRHPWVRLAAAARQVSDERDVQAPYGFATRVAAQAFSCDHRISLLERSAWRAAGVAGLLALLSVAVNYRALAGSVADPAAEEEILSIDDAVAVLLDFTH